MAHFPPMRLKRSAVRVVVLVVALVAWVGPVPALAAHPVPSGRYLLSAPDPDSSDGPSHMGVLQVSRSGRALTSEGIPWSPWFYDYFGSYFEDLVSCAGPPDEEIGSTYEANAEFRFGAPENRPVRIDRDGRFDVQATSDEGGDAKIALRGQFVSRAKAVLSIVAGTYQVDADSPDCAIPPRTFHFRLRPMPRFGSCARAPGRMVLESARGRVYKTWGVDEMWRDRWAYACLFGGRAIALGAAPGGVAAGDGAVQKFRLAGLYVSYVNYLNHESGWVEKVVVVDLRGRGRTVRVEPPSTKKHPDYHLAATPLLTARGSSAWVAYDCSQRTCGHPYEVWIADRAGKRRVDHGSGIDPASLALSGRRVTWTHHGVRRSAPIDARR